MLKPIAKLLFRSLADNRRPNSLAARLRRNRLALLEDLWRDVEGVVRILDVGGTTAFWKNVSLARNDQIEIVILNREPERDVPLQGMKSVLGDARSLSQFQDGSFDLVFSNSVIEHVGSVDDQCRMAAEVRRIGKCYFVQTPNRYFPIEPHFLVPGFQFLPRPLQISLVQRFDLGWYTRKEDAVEATRLVDSHRLLDATELQAMFPEAKIVRERFAGFTKSLIALYDGSSARTHRTEPQRRRASE